MSQAAGSDQNTGSQSSPFRTIDAALSAVRGLNTAANSTIAFIDSTYHLDHTISIDNTLLNASSSLILKGASGNTTMYEGSTISSSNLAIDDSLLPTQNSSYAFGGMYGYVNGVASNNPITGAMSCPTGQTSVMFLNTTGSDWPAYFCYSADPNNAGAVDFGGMYGTVSGQPTVNPVTGAASCPSGYSATTFYGQADRDYPMTFCSRPHQSGQTADYSFGGMYGYINSGTAVSNPLTNGMSCPSGYTSAQVFGTQNVDWPAYFCYRKNQSSLPGHVYVIPVTSEPSGVVINGQIASRASYAPQVGSRDTNGTFTVQMPSSAASHSDSLIAVGTHAWRMFRCSIASLTPKSGTSNLYTATLDSVCQNANDTYGLSTISQLEGDTSFFSQSGQWVYLSAPTPRVAVYLTNPATVTVVPSTQQQLVTIAGSAAQHVHNVTITGVNFMYGGYQNQHNYVTIQSGITQQPGGANARQQAAVEIQNADHVTVTNGQFSHLFGAGIWVGHASNDIHIDANTFSDLAGTAIEAGDWNPLQTQANATQNVTFNHNTINGTGKVFADSCGIFATYIKDSEVAYNTISSIPYTGISLGWGWSYNPQIGLGNLSVHDNTISNVMQSLNDGGGIYLNSRMDGTTVFNNTINTVAETQPTYPNSYPLYSDDGNGGVTYHNNQIIQPNFDQLKNITRQQPIFGPSYPVSTSPCSYKACNITQYANTVQ